MLVLMNQRWPIADRTSRRIVAIAVVELKASAPERPSAVLGESEAGFSRYAVDLYTPSDRRTRTAVWPSAAVRFVVRFTNRRGR